MQKDSFDIWSPQLRNRRGVDVYLPDSYDEGRRRYPVVYMQDGQNLSDPAIAFGGNTWHLSTDCPGWRNAASSRSSSASTTRAERLAEYSPFPDARHGGGGGDRYARFLIDTVKTRIDAHYRTRKDRASTVVAGSSMGGLISLYAFFRRPSPFGAAAVLSPSVWFGGREILSFVQRSRMTTGTALPRRRHQRGDRARCATRGRSTGCCGARATRGTRSGTSRRRAAQHREADWAWRLPQALEFLLRER